MIFSSSYISFGDIYEAQIWATAQVAVTGAGANKVVLTPYVPSLVNQATSWQVVNEGFTPVSVLDNHTPKAVQQVYTATLVLSKTNTKTVYYSPLYGVVNGGLPITKTLQPSIQPKITKGAHIPKLLNAAPVSKVVN